MLRAFRLSTGADGHSHVEKGFVEQQQSIEADTIEFEETGSHGSLSWHNAPVPQYVVTLSGTLEFETKTGEMFTVTPGDVLIALDVRGTGHRWRLIDDQPWMRAYVTIRGGVDRSFVAL